MYPWNKGLAGKVTGHLWLPLCLAFLAVCTTGSALGQALPRPSVNLGPNGRVHMTWAVPTVSCVLQESAGPSALRPWQASALTVTTNGCTCSVGAIPTNTSRFYRLVSTNPPPIGLYLGPATNLFAQRALGMKGVPDMHTALMLQPDRSYRVWIAGAFEDGAVGGATGLLLTTNLLSYTPGFGSSTQAVPVMVPTCRDATYSNSCVTNFDAHYAGADLVFAATNGTDLLMIYHAAMDLPSTTTNEGTGWAVVGLARSSDQGLTWTNRQPIISSSDPKPDTSPAAAVTGVVEPGAIIAKGYIYTYYAYFPTQPTNNPAPPTLQVARAPVAGDGAPGTWFKYYTNSFASEPGLGGQGSQVVASACACTRPAQPWPVFSTYLNAYVLVFICDEGWFFCTSTDLVNWTSPTQFLTALNREFGDNEPTDENVILVTPGNPDQVIGQSGYVLYAHTDAWNHIAHELWMRPFSFAKNP